MSDRLSLSVLYEIVLCFAMPLQMLFVMLPYLLNTLNCRCFCLLRCCFILMLLFKVYLCNLLIHILFDIAVCYILPCFLFFFQCQLCSVTRCIELQPVLWCGPSVFHPSDLSEAGVHTQCTVPNPFTRLSSFSFCLLLSVGWPRSALFQLFNKRFYGFWCLKTIWRILLFLNFW